LPLARKQNHVLRSVPIGWVLQRDPRVVKEILFGFVN
jgi:hypothetical protein